MSQCWNLTPEPLGRDFSSASVAVLGCALAAEERAELLGALGKLKTALMEEN